MRLVLLANPDVVHWTLSPGTRVVGREPACDVVVDDCTVSRRHASLSVVHGQPVRVADHGSRNGTWINGQRVTGDAVATVGDLISFGVVTLRLESGTGVSGQTAAEAYHEDIAESEQVVRRLSPSHAMKKMDDGEAAGIAFRAFADMAGMLASQESLESMCQEALKRLASIVEGERFAVFLCRDGGNGLDLVAKRQVRRSAPLAFCRSRTILDEVLKGKQAIHFCALAGDPRFKGRQSIVRQRIRSAMAVPLIDRGRVLGVLYVDTTKPKQRYTEDALKLVSVFGHLLAAKIMQHQLMQEKSDKKSFESELRLASRIQKEFMPIELPEIDGYAFQSFQVQCKQVGGDLYDVARLPDGRVFFLIADVCGKSMGAALLASSILSAFRILRSQQPFDLVDAVRRVSLELIHSSRMSDFATLFVAVLDPNRHQMDYVNAGHDPPLMVAADGRHHYLESGNMAIGVMDDETWTSHRIATRPGDRMLLCTDGLLEATNMEGEMYSKERLVSFTVEQRATAAAEFAQALVNDVYGFRKGSPPLDDMTLIVLDRL